jgi:hypothetical protein
LSESWKRKYSYLFHGECSLRQKNYGKMEGVALKRLTSDGDYPSLFA